MPMDPMDVMWMSKAPTVSDVVSKSNIVFKPAVGQNTNAPTTVDVGENEMWKPSRLSRMERTMSVGSSDSDMIERKTSYVESSTTQPIECRPRRMSISGMIFGSPGGFGWGQNSNQNSPVGSFPERRMSITEDVRFKDLIKQQNKILGDDGVGSGFKRKDYTMP